MPPDGVSRPSRSRSPCPQSIAPCILPVRVAKAIRLQGIASPAALAATPRRSAQPNARAPPGSRTSMSMFVFQTGCLVLFRGLFRGICKQMMQADHSPAAALERRQWGHWRVEHNDSLGIACSHAVRELCHGDPSRIESYDWDKTLIGIHVVSNAYQRHLPRSQVFFFPFCSFWDIRLICSSGISCSRSTPSVSRR